MLYEREKFDRKGAKMAMFFFTTKNDKTKNKQAKSSQRLEA